MNTTAGPLKPVEFYIGITRVLDGTLRSASSAYKTEQKLLIQHAVAADSQATKLEAEIAVQPQQIKRLGKFGQQEYKWGKSKG